MPRELSPLITQSLLGAALPDRVQISVFADSPRATGHTGVYTVRADSYFGKRKGAKRHYDYRDPIGQCYVWREGQDTIKFGIGPESFSMTLSFNVMRHAVVDLCLGGARTRHGNVVPTSGTPSRHRMDLRRYACETIADRVAWAKRRYAKLVRAALGLQAQGEARANLSILELSYDFPPRDASKVESYRRAFNKLFRPQPGDGLSGRLRKGERFGIYVKTEEETGTPTVLRFEMALSGKWIKRATGSQRVPDQVSGVERVLLALEETYLPVLLEVERHRQPSPRVTLGALIGHFRKGGDWGLYDRIARKLGRDGKIKTGPKNRGPLTTMRRRGLVENPAAITRNRGYWVTAPRWDRPFQKWGQKL